MESTAISAVTDGVPSSATVIAPLNVSKLPRTLLTMRWRTEKPMVECTGSMAQVPVLRPVLTAAVMGVSFSRSWRCRPCADTHIVNGPPQSD